MSRLLHPHSDTISPDCIPQVPSPSNPLSTSVTHTLFCLYDFRLFLFPPLHSRRVLLTAAVSCPCYNPAFGTSVSCPRTQGWLGYMTTQANDKLELMHRLWILRAEHRDRSQCEFSRIFHLQHSFVCLSSFIFLLLSVRLKNSLNSWSETKEK